MTAGYRSITVRPLCGALGAEILDVDVAALTDEQFADVRRAYFQYSVIFFRHQRLTPDDHIAFARRWGDININRFFKPVASHPIIAEVRKEPHQTLNIGNRWHTDHSYDVAPALGSVLYAIEVPAVGGDTLFASMYLAYESLSSGMQKMLETLSAQHSSRHVFGVDTVAGADNDKHGRIGNPHLATQDAIHPVVITHPDTKRKALYVNPIFTVGICGWSAQESEALLGFLYQHAIQTEFQCRFVWEQGSVAFWDNRATQHVALNDYHGHRRLMHRITVEGVALDGSRAA